MVWDIVPTPILTRASKIVGLARDSIERSERDGRTDEDETKTACTRSVRRVVLGVRYQCSAREARENVHQIQGVRHHDSSRGGDELATEYLAIGEQDRVKLRAGASLPRCGEGPEPAWWALRVASWYSKNQGWG
jgi:hypothetical protein